MTVFRNTNIKPQDPLETWQVVHLDERFDSAQQIAAHLKQQLLAQGTGTPLTLVLPCPLTLAGIYDRGVLDVLDALFELRKQGCQYRVYGLDGDIQLWAPEHTKTEHTKTQNPKTETPPHTHFLRELLKPVDILTHRAQQSLSQFLILEG